MRNENTTCHCNCESLGIELGPVVLDERTKYVEHVLDVLRASRTAPDRPYLLLTRIKNEPTVDKAVSHDLTIERLIRPCKWTTTKRRSSTRSPALAARRATAGGIDLSDRYASENSLTTLARGSPRC